MNKIFKSRMFAFIFGLIVAGSVGVAAYTYNASQIEYSPSDNTWDVHNVKAAIDDLKTNGTNKKFCELKEGTALAIGSKYECDPGDGTKRNFYVLEVRTNNLDLIMDRDITQGTGTTTMTWQNAMKYIDNNNLKASWKDVNNIDLPKAQQIADAVGNSSWKAAENAATWWCFASHTQDSQSEPGCNTSQASAYNWLYDYTRNCNGCSHNLGEGEAYGYWTRDTISGSTNPARVWIVNRRGNFNYADISYALDYGVRPVITISKSNIK